MTVVRIKLGELRGEADAGVHRFLGIPYAEAPVAERRFAPPEARQPWGATRDATVFGPVCPQSGPPNRIDPGDDYLNLNIWTPDPGAAGLPVLVWIHGGGFRIGAGSDAMYDGTAFARDGVVCVTFNYRLGSLGFLAIDGAGDAGSFGLLDQIAALEWVQDHIAAFGGDPSRVTVAGSSSGGMSVATLLASPPATGLFRRAIAQSGAAHNGMSPQTAAQVASLFAEQLGGPFTLDEARAMPLARLLDADGVVGPGLLNRSLAGRVPALDATAMPLAFQPVWDTDALPDRPIDGIRGGMGAGVDLLVGTTADEIRVPDGPEIDNMRAFHEPAVRLAEAQSAHATVHAYRFDWKSPAHGGRIGAAHGIELGFVFDTAECDMARSLNGGAAPRELVDATHQAWVAFATSGDPSCAALPFWPAYDIDRRATMCLDVESAVVDDPFAEERQRRDTAS